MNRYPGRQRTQPRERRLRLAGDQGRPVGFAVRDAQVRVVEAGRVADEIRVVARGCAGVRLPGDSGGRSEACCVELRRI
jgi:hypothetical protein